MFALEVRWLKYAASDHRLHRIVLSQRGGRLDRRLVVRWLRIVVALSAGILVAPLVLAAPRIANVHLVTPTSGSVGWHSLGLPAIIVHSLALGHRQPELVFAATIQGVYRRDGTHWQHMLGNQDVWSIELLPDDRTVIAGDNAGYVDISHDAGQRWRRILVAAHGVFAVSAQPGNPNHILAGAAGGIYLSRDGGWHWQRRLRLIHSAVDTFAWQPGSREVVFAGSVSGGRGGNTGVLVSRDGGLTWHQFGSDLGSLAGVMSLAVTTSQHVFAGTMGNAVWVASRTGAWRKAAHGMPLMNDHGAGLATVPGQPRTVFVGTLGYGVFRTTDGGDHWTDISTGLPTTRSANVVLSISYSPAQHTLYAGTADGVYVNPRP
jgi:photosystem II stability/assembly factor-like uncharacterized protein